MAQIAEEAQLGRESLYKTLSEEGNPTWDTLMKIMNAVKLRLSVESGESGKKAS
jgi:probable addiction module antidote protein